jgi:hypothetical protein
LYNADKQSLEINLLNQKIKLKNNENNSYINNSNSHLKDLEMKQQTKYQKEKKNDKYKCRKQ